MGRPASSTWTLEQTFSFYDGDGDFGGSDFQCRVLRSDGKGVKEIILDSREKWEEWLKTSEENLANPDNQITPGYEILLSARVSPIFDGIEVDISELPFSQAYWERIERFLFVHKSVLHAMGPSGYLDSKSSDSFPTNINDTAANIYYASNVGSFLGRLAVSSTYFVGSRFTTAVVYGCDGHQMNTALRILEKSDSMRDHTFLSAWLFTELQWDQMLGRLTRFLTATNNVDTKLQVNNPNRKTSRWKELKIMRARRLHNMLRQCRLESGAMIDEITTITQPQVQELLDDVERLLSSQGDSTPSLRSRSSKSSYESPTKQQGDPMAAKLVSDHEFRSSGKLQRRLKEISRNYNIVISRCERGLNNLTFTRDDAMTNLNNILAEQAARDAKASKALGFAAMVYLPITSLATIFALPIFDWKARWLDHNIHYVPPQPSATDSSGAGDSTSPTSDADRDHDPGTLAVISGYFWIYLGVAIFATLFTVGWYVIHTRQDIRRYLQYPGRFYRWVLRIVRII